MKRMLLSALLLLMLAGSSAQAAGDAVERLFASATVAERDAALVEVQTMQGGTAQMALAGHKAFAALEGFAQALHRHGFQTPRTMIIPLMRLPVPENPSPEPLTYEAWRDIIKALDDGLGEAIVLLDALPAGSDAAFVVDLRAMRFDMDGDGQLTEAESVGAILAALANPGGWNVDTGKDDAPPPVFRFDRADAYWLQGYANFLRANTKLWLAHDFHTTVDASFQLFFPLAGLAADGRAGGEDMSSIFDLIAFIHTINWPVVDAGARADIRLHVLEMIRLSRLDWQAILAETDNDREWLPGPQQPGRHPLTELEITQDTIALWHGTLDVMERVLNGEILVPHPRFPGYGINLKRLFDEPQPLDLVMLVTGYGALPYLEQGEVLDLGAWNDIANAFGRGNFLSYAVWIN